MFASGRAVIAARVRRVASALAGLLILAVAAPVQADPFTGPIKSPTYSAPWRPLPPPPAPKGRPTTGADSGAPPVRRQSTPMPNLTGMPLPAAVIVLATRGLKASAIVPTPSEARAGLVVGQQPAPFQQVTVGSAIVLNVSDEALVTVPDLRGQTPQQAAGALRAEGLSPGRQSQAISTLEPPGRIIHTEPQGGSEEPRGSSVDYQIALAQPLPPPPPPVVVAPLAPPPPPLLPPSPISAGPPAPPPPAITPTNVAAPTNVATPVASASPVSAATVASSGPVAPAPATPVANAPSSAAAPGWLQTHWSWLALAAVLVAAAAAIARWALLKPAVAALAAVPPVTVTASVPHGVRSTIENPHPATGPAVSIAWRIDPPDPRIEEL